jgi:hypothetical protein
VTGICRKPDFAGPTQDHFQIARDQNYGFLTELNQSGFVGEGIMLNKQCFGSKVSPQWVYNLYKFI